jgi:hypothetical protein
MKSKDSAFLEMISAIGRKPETFQLKPWTDSAGNLVQNAVQRRASVKAVMKFLIP